MQTGLYQGHNGIGGKALGETEKTPVNYLTDYLTPHDTGKHWCYSVLYPSSVKVVGLEGEDAIKGSQVAF